MPEMLLHFDENKVNKDFRVLTFNVLNEAIKQHFCSLNTSRTDQSN